MNRIISETVATLENLKMRVVLGRVESDLEIEDTLQDAIDSIRNAPLATTLDQSVQTRSEGVDLTYWKDANKQTSVPIHNAGQVGGDCVKGFNSSGLPDALRTAQHQNSGQVSAEVVSREIRRKAFEEKAKHEDLDLEHCHHDGEDEYISSSTERAYEIWCDAWNTALRTTQPPTVPQPVHGVPSDWVSLLEELASQGPHEGTQTQWIERLKDKASELLNRQEGRS